MRKSEASAAIGCDRRDLGNDCFRSQISFAETHIWSVGNDLCGLHGCQHDLDSDGMEASFDRRDPCCACVCAESHAFQGEIGECPMESRGLL